MRLSPGTAAIVALAAGFAVGAGAAALQPAAAQALLAVADPVGTLWVNAIRMTVIPLVVALLISGIGALDDVRSVGRLGGGALVLFIAIVAFAAVMSAILAPRAFAFLEVDAAAALALRERMAVGSTTIPELPTFTSWVTGLVPPNPIKAAVDGAMLPLIVFSVAFALGIARVGGASRDTLFGFFRATGEAMLILVRWVLALSPIGVFALAISLGARVGVSAAGAIGFYLVTLSALCALAALSFYPFAALGGRTPLGLFARAVLPAQIVAATTRSSLAALPAMLDGAERTLALPRTTSTFVLPLAVSTLRPNVPIAWVVGALFIGKLYGIELGSAALATIAVAGAAMSFSVPGIPSGSLFIIAPFFPPLGLPVEGVGILIALDTIPDIFKTGCNVTAHMTVATILGRRAPAPEPAAARAPETAAP